MADVERRIKREWFPPGGTESKRVVVQFKIHRGGELSNLRLDHSSGFAIADQAALKAVDSASPFRPLPQGAPEVVDIRFNFDYNVIAGSVTKAQEPTQAETEQLEELSKLAKQRHQQELENQQ
jgi:TonB family protein